MSGLQAIDVGLGLMFIYLILSLVCTAINEFLAGQRDWRKNELSKGIQNLLAGSGLSHLYEDFKKHPLIKSLYGENLNTSYIHPHIFSSVLVDLAHPPAPSTPAGDPVPDNSPTTPPNTSTLETTLRPLLRDGEEHFQKLKTHIETVYNETMVGVSGAYKRKTQRWIVIIALVVTGISNADTIEIAKALSQDPELRAAMVAKIQATISEPQNERATTSPAPKKEMPKNGASSKDKTPPSNNNGGKEVSLKDLQSLGIPLGWYTLPTGLGWLNKFIGLLITALAVSMGAPFWFDMLKKVVNVRAGSMSPEDMEKQRKKQP